MENVGAGQALAVLAVLAAAALPALCAERLGYTFSLALFLVPVAAMLGWLKKRCASEWKKLRGTLLASTAALTPTGFLLNLCFADAFFVWPNQAAVLGVTVPSLGLFGPRVGIPVEEFAFYTLGFLGVTLAYVWSGKALFKRPEPRASSPEHFLRTASTPRSFCSIPRVSGLGSGAFLVAALCVAGVIAQRVWNPSATLPGYLLYLALVPFLGTLLLYGKVRARVNAPALTFTVVATLAVSVAWEASLAIPQGWWGYQSEAMVGLFIGRWSRLPVEAVLVWALVGFAAAVTWEHLRLRFEQLAPSTRAAGPSTVGRQRPGGGS